MCSKLLEKEGLEMKGKRLSIICFVLLFAFGWAKEEGVTTGQEWIQVMGEYLTSAHGVSVDMEGNVYVVGETGGTLPGQERAGGNDVFVRKYDGNGKEVWTRQFGTEDEDCAHRVFVDVEGNVYVVGYIRGTLVGQEWAGKKDAFVRKYDGNGKEVWTRQFGTERDDEAYGVSVDREGNVYVVGVAGGTLPGQKGEGKADAFVCKYDDNGKEVWTRQFGTEGDDIAFGVSVDDTGNVYVVGQITGLLSGQEWAGEKDAFVRKYDGNGKEIWTRQFGTGGWDSAFGVSADGVGNVYVVGVAGGTLPGQKGEGRIDAFVRKYDGNGKEVWTRQFGTEGLDFARGVSVDKAGNVYVVGAVEKAFPGQRGAGGNDAFVRKYDGNGEEIWTRQFGTEGLDEAHGVSVDGGGNVYVVGQIMGPIPGQAGWSDINAFVRRYNGDGKEMWGIQFGTEMRRPRF
jgi:hypothetical protein